MLRLVLGGCRPLTLSMVNRQRPDTGNKLIEEDVRFGKYGHMATVLKQHQFFFRRLDGGKILIDQLGRRVHVGFALEKEHWRLELAPQAPHRT